ncbi:MAG: excinuclease ABC subunit UvrC [Flavobacteriaceae bacterium]|jgi:excinuclease ABC subunit C|nr:excinuclease ABC subunit UvrC [Flavobacteriaceae bacterium]
MDIKSLKIISNNLPSNPGVYQFFDSKNNIIYIGKAKNLKKRVNSYFSKQSHTGKTNKLISNISFIKHILVKTESDALLLENNLIKKYKPKYNIQLKDGKSYPWMCIKNERFPRLFITRKLIHDGSEYYGPYTSIKTIHTLLDLINNLFPIRLSNYNLTEKKINDNKNKLSLRLFRRDGHSIILGFNIEGVEKTNETKLTETQYKKNIDLAREILKGKFSQFKIIMKKKMQQYSKNMQYEKAQEIKEKLIALENYQSKSTIVNPKINNVDVFTVYSEMDYAYINFLQICYGSIVRSYNTEIKKKFEVDDKEILKFAILEIRSKFNSESKEIYTNCKINLGKTLKLSLPKTGDKKRIVDLSLKNAKHFRINQLQQRKQLDPEAHYQRILNQAKTDLKLNKEPYHIECFDNSNLQGTNATSACVVFKNAKPNKKEYRYFNIKEVIGPNDFAMMQEIVYRRYSRLLKEKQSLPELVIIDGGKGQLSSALKALIELKLDKKIALIGIAKRLEDIYFPNESIPLYLDKRSETLKLIQNLRNEAHRFSLKHHRNKRSSSFLTNELEQIKGIGEKTILDLLRHFKSNRNISTAKIKDLKKIVGETRALLIYNYYKSR